MSSGLLLMAVMGLLFPAVLHATRTELHFGKSELALSRFTSCVMLVAYAAFLVFQLKSQSNLYLPVNEVSTKSISLLFSFGLTTLKIPHILSMELYIFIFALESHVFCL